MPTLKELQVNTVNKLIELENKEVIPADFVSALNAVLQTVLPYTTKIK